MTIFIKDPKTGRLYKIEQLVSYNPDTGEDQRHFSQVKFTEVQEDHPIPPLHYPRDEELEP